MASKLLMQIVNFPAFLFSISVFYWSLPLLAIPNKVQVFNFRVPRNDVHNWALALKQFFRINILHYGTNKLYHGGFCLYLCNHRSWADFFVDPFLTQGQAAIMSRWLVFMAFPFFCCSVMILKAIVLFKRGAVYDKEKFNNWLDTKLKESPMPGFLVYPEGHRSLLQTSLPLKRGMLHYAYSRKMRLQIIITKGKEQVLSEKQVSMHFGKTLVTGYSKVLDAGAYESFDAFFTDLQQHWDALWKEVYAADPSKLSPIKFDHIPCFAYPLSMKILQLVAAIFSTLALVGAVYCWWRGLTWFLVLFGAYQQVVAALLVTWVSSSMLVACLT